VRELFRRKEFIAYFVGRQSAQLAFSIESVAIGWQVYGLRHHVFDLGIVGLLLFLPGIALALPAGIAADRVDRRLLCAVCALVEAVCECVFVALVLSGSHSIGLYFGAVALIGAAHAFGSPAERALLAGIVHSRHFVRAQALSSTFNQLISVAGPAIGGALIVLSVPLAFGVAACSFVLAAIGFSQLRPGDVERGVALEPHDVFAGLRSIFRRPIVLGAISLDLFAVLFGGATALLPAYATSVLHVGAFGFGLLRSAPAFGAAIVAGWIVPHPITRRAGPLLFSCVAGFGIATILFGLSRTLWLSLLTLAAAGGFDVVSVVIRGTLVQLGTANAMRGRVTAIENVFIDASNQLGAFESGGVAALIGITGSIILGGAATLVVIGLWALLFPALRKLDRLAS
jgi:MFS family permease